MAMGGSMNSMQLNGGMRQPNFGIANPVKSESGFTTKVIHNYFFHIRFKYLNSPLGWKVHEVYKRYGDSEMGLSFDQAIGYLKEGGVNISLQQMRATVEALSGEGVLYTTIDEMHYKSTDWEVLETGVIFVAIWLVLVLDSFTMNFVASSTTELDIK